MSIAKGIRVNLMNKEFHINCPDGQEQQLLAAAEYLELSMKDIRDSGKIIGTERIAIMAALNIAHDLLILKNQQTDLSCLVREKVHKLSEKLDLGMSQVRSRARQRSIL